MDARVEQYELRVEIAADPGRVWQLLTVDINDWWLPDFHMLGSDSVVTLQPQAGGLLTERAGRRQLLWYTVLMIVPEEQLDLQGYCSADFGGPATSLLTLKLRKTETGTELSVRDSLYGHVTEAQVQSLRSGWTQLFETGLKACAERKL